MAKNKKKQKKQTHLGKRRGPKLQFVIPAHRQEFEQNVIDIYMESEEGGFWGALPSVDAQVAPFVRSKFQFASLYGDSKNDKDAFYHDLEPQMIDGFIDLWCEANLQKLVEEDIQYGLYVQQGTVLDAAEVLNFHRMCHAIQIGDHPGEHGTGLQAFRHLPMQNLW